MRKNCLVLSTFTEIFIFNVEISIFCAIVIFIQSYSKEYQIIMIVQLTTELLPSTTVVSER